MSLIVKRDHMCANSSHTNKTLFFEICSCAHFVDLLSVSSLKDVQHNYYFLHSPFTRKTLLPHRSWEAGLVFFPIAPCMVVDTADKQINKPEYGLQYFLMPWLPCRWETQTFPCKHKECTVTNAFRRDVLRTKQTNVTSFLNIRGEILAPKIERFWHLSFCNCFAKNIFFI